MPPDEGDAFPPHLDIPDEALGKERKLEMEDSEVEVNP